MRAQLCLFLLLSLVRGFGQSAPDDLHLPSTAHQYKIEKLADGIFAAIRTEPPNLMVMANSTFIINKNGVVVVDTGLTPAYAAELISEIKKLTPKPVTQVINTHWHDDHIMGNAKFREAYPKVQFLAHESFREYLPGKGVENRKKMFEGAPPVIKDLRESIQAGKTLGGKELSPEERESYATSVAMAEQYMKEVPNTEVVMPSPTFKDEFVMKDPAHTVEVRHLGRSHTAGDVVVYLPKQKIVITGDLVIAPVPLIGSDQSYVGDWSESLKKLAAMDAKTIVPGHGPVMHDMTYVQRLQRLMASIDEQTRAAAKRGETLDQARKSVDLQALRKEFAGDDKVLNFLFSAYVVGPGVAAAYKDAKPQ